MSKLALDGYVLTPYSTYGNYVATKIVAKQIAKSGEKMSIEVITLVSKPKTISVRIESPEWQEYLIY